LITLKDIHLHYPTQTVLRDLNVRVALKDRIALIGGNGTGKSTLLKILAGVMTPNEGRVEIPSGVTIGYLPQTGLSFRGRSLWDEMLTALPAWLERRRKRKELLQRIASTQPDDPNHEKIMAEYGETETLYQQENGYTQESRLKGILAGLGFNEHDHHRQVEAFSAGWQMRIGLAKLLASNPDFMLLDEPTDHLDLEAKNWLEEYLFNGKSGFILVSHDRHLLDILPERLMEMEEGRLAIYTGNYTRCLAEKQKRQDVALKDHLLQQKEVKRLETYITRNRARKDRAQQVQSRMRQLEKMELLDKGKHQADLRFRFPSPSRTPRVLVELTDVEKTYHGSPLIRNLSLLVERGERIAVVGPNGTGKSTLMRILLGKESIQKGSRLVGDRVSIGWFSQDAASGFREDASALDALLSVDPLTTLEKGRGLLARFGLRGDHVFKSVGTLSGGERVRLALAALLLHRHHLLLLDEPTNHLDILARQALLDALLSYNGTLVFVSHDRYFIQELATRTLEIREGCVRSLLGEYEDYLAAKETGHRTMDLLSDVLPTTLQEASPQTDKQDKEARILERERKKRKQRTTQKQVRQRVGIEAEIEGLERELADLEMEMQAPAVAKDFEKLRSLHEQAEGIRKDLEERYATWETLIKEGDSESL